MPDSSFTDFVGASLPPLTRYAYALTGDPHAGEDLVQDTLVKLAGAWRRVRHDGNPLGYAKTVMFRTYVSRWRVLRHRPVLQDYRGDEAEPGDPYADIESRDVVWRALAGLPRLQRAVLVLGYLDDLADEDIAALLDRRPSTIRSLRHRGLRALRKRLEPHNLSEVTHGTN